MSWFTPKLPVDEETKAWVDEAFGWLIDEIGIEVLREVEVVLPTEDFFPDPYNGSRASIRKMVDRVCGYMDVDPALIEVRFFENEDSFYGLGIFNANSSFVFEQFTNAQFQGWRAGGAGYLSEEAFAYALALFARLRGETKPPWSKHLSTNVRSYFKSASRYLAKTGDSSLIARLENSV